MKIGKLRNDLLHYIKEHKLERKWAKVSFLFEINPSHPSLKTELLEPHWHGIYSFRIDKKYRVLFFITPEQTAEIIAITNHYKK